MDSPDSLDALCDVADNFGYPAYFCELLNRKLNVDVTFIIETEDGDVEIHAHQLILSMRSSHFEDLFYGKEETKKRKEKKLIHLQKMNAKAFEDMIRFCYDCKPDLGTLQEICALFRIAYKFEVMSLMNHCRTCLSEMEILPGNVFDMLEVSELMEDKEHINACHKFLEENTARVMESYEMIRVTPSMVSVVLALPKLSLKSEFELIKWIMDWVTAKMEEKVSQSARDYLENFLPCMNFLALDFEKFATLCKDYPGYFTLEEIASICLNIANPGAMEMPKWYDKTKVREYTGQYLRSEILNNDTVAEEKTDASDLRSDMLSNDTVAREKIITFIDIAETLLKSWKESIKCCTERVEYLEKQDSGVIEKFLIFYLSFKHDELCITIAGKLAKLIGSDRDYEEIISKIKSQVQRFERMLTLLENGAEPDILTENEIKDVDQDHVFERMKKEHADTNRSGSFKQLIEGTEEYQRMRKILYCIEENRILELLDDLHGMHKSYAESEKIYDLLELGKDCYELMVELRQINDRNIENCKKAGIKLSS